MRNDNVPALLPAKLIPERIREAREARGLTAEQMADLLEVSRQAVAQFETGQAAPSPSTFRKIIAHTSQPLSFFTTVPARVGEPTTTFFRSLKRMEQTQRKRIGRRLQWASDIVNLLERFIEIPVVNLPQIDFDPLVDGDEEIEDAAEKLREHWNLCGGPIIDLTGVLENNGVIVVREKVRCSDMDAVSCWISGRPLVLLSEEVTSGPRDLFNLAHELAHLILHSSVEVNSSNLSSLEKQANRFASAFLLPRVEFSREVLGSSVLYFKTLKERWGVSIAAMIYRSKDLGVLSDNQCSYLFKQMNIRKIRKIEPLDDKFPVADPTVLKEGISMLVENKVYTPENIEEDLGLNLKDVEEICSLVPGYLDRRVIKFRPHLILKR